MNYYRLNTNNNKYLLEFIENFDTNNVDLNKVLYDYNHNSNLNKHIYLTDESLKTILENFKYAPTLERYNDNSYFGIAFNFKIYCLDEFENFGEFYDVYADDLEDNYMLFGDKLSMLNLIEQLNNIDRITITKNELISYDNYLNNFDNQLNQLS